MKRGKIIAFYYKGHKFEILFISFVFTFLLFYLIFILADVTPYGHALKLYEHANLQNSFYYVASGGLDEPYSEPDIPTLQSTQAIRDVVYLKYGRFEDESSKIIYNIYAFPDSAADAFPLQATEGEWLADFSETDEQESPIRAVVCGDGFADTHLHGILTMKEMGSGLPLQIKAAGKLRESSAIPYFGASGNISSESLFQIANYSNYIILVREKDINRLATYNFCFSGLGCFVRIKESESPENISAAMNYLNTTGYITPYQEICSRGKELWIRRLKEGVIFPAMSAFIFSFIYVSVFILAFEQRRRDIKIFFLCGYTVRKATIDFMISMLFPIAIPSAAALLFLAKLLPVSPELILYLLFDDTSKTIGTDSIMAICLYFTICLGVSWMLARQQISALAGDRKTRR